MAQKVRAGGEGGRPAVPRERAPHLRRLAGPRRRPAQTRSKQLDRDVRRRLRRGQLRLLRLRPVGGLAADEATGRSTSTSRTGRPASSTARIAGEGQGRIPEVDRRRGADAATTASRRWSRTCSAAARPAASPGRSCSPRRWPRSRRSSTGPGRSTSEPATLQHGPRPRQRRRHRQADAGAPPVHRRRREPLRPVRPADRLRHRPRTRTSAATCCSGVKPLRLHRRQPARFALPPAPLRVEIEQGAGISPRRTEVHLGRRQARAAVRACDRWIDLRAEGWYSGDTRVPFPVAARRPARRPGAEDLAVVNLLAMETDIPGPFQQHGAGHPEHHRLQRPAARAWQVAGHGVAVNTLNRHPVLGSLGLLALPSRRLPAALRRPRGNDDWTLADWCDQCHRKRGLVVWTGPKQPRAADHRRRSRSPT